VAAERQLVRVVVVNFNGEGFLRSCLEHLLATTWPEDRLEIVLVDNNSTDGSLESIADLPRIRLIRSFENLGFAGGSNLGMADLASVDYVALINSDAFVSPDWLSPLVDALEQDPKAGAASAKLLFAPRFKELVFETDGFVPTTNDGRLLGVLLSGMVSTERPGWREIKFRTGFYDEEGSVAGTNVARWSAARGVLDIPVPGDGPQKVQLRLSAERDKLVKITCGGSGTSAPVSITPTWVELTLDGPSFDLINNAGEILLPGGYGADRGFGERDEGQFDTPAEVFAWCGAAVLLRSRYLRDVGIFDEDYFLYYEDFDLAWRGRSRGWSYLYVPDSVVRHIHTASTVEGSPLFTHYVQRNRLLTLVKNAPAAYAARETAFFAGHMVSVAIDHAASSVRPDRKADSARTRQQLRPAAGFARRLPRALAQRRQIFGRRTVPARALLDWTTTR
jgi:GT2 family glycosyltransferase